MFQYVTIPNTWLVKNRKFAIVTSRATGENGKKFEACYIYHDAGTMENAFKNFLHDSDPGLTVSRYGVMYGDEKETFVRSKDLNSAPLWQVYCSSVHCNPDIDLIEISIEMYCLSEQSKDLKGL